MLYEDLSMKLAVYTAAADAAGGQRASCSSPSFQDCRDLASHQAAPIAAKLCELLDKVESALEQDAPDLFALARRLEEAAGYIAWVRRSHEDSQSLQRMIARLLLESFGRPEWRAPFIAGLQHA